ncbi:hypothetical protein F5B19DRAFT_479829 [Rostrohypoxylon terebratum]|nr:hypothetical protein F5B19DRAFT_479829 [Rostrohypoxylon terebratum]
MTLIKRLYFQTVKTESTMALHVRDQLSFAKVLVHRVTIPPLIPHVAYHAIIWTGVSLCILAFSCRLVIRTVCFRRLLFEDYFMLLSLIILIATAIILQVLVQYCYNIEEVRIGNEVIMMEFLEGLVKGLHGHVALMMMNYIGIWLIKFSFLIFLSRLGERVTKYRVFWWIVLIFNIISGVAAIAIIPFGCLLAPVDSIILVCKGRGNRIFANLNSIISCLLDAVGDAMIIGFPIYVLWNVRIDVRKKLVLTALFSLVVFTVLVTIVRGSIFSGAYVPVDQPDTKPVNVAWLWFWFCIEYIISFIVACLISFRCLFTQIESDTINREAIQVYRPQPKGFREKMRTFRVSMCNTLMTLEGFTRVDSEMFALPSPPAGSLSLTFEGSEESDRV